MWLGSRSVAVHVTVMAHQEQPPKTQGGSVQRVHATVQVQLNPKAFFCSRKWFRIISTSSYRIYLRLDLKAEGPNRCAEKFVPFSFWFRGVDASNLQNLCFFLLLILPFQTRIYRLTHPRLFLSAFSRQNIVQPANKQWPPRQLDASNLV